MSSGTKITINEQSYVVKGLSNDGDLSVRRIIDGEILEYKPDQTSFDILKGRLIKK
jgi:hypothetical protein